MSVDLLSLVVEAQRSAVKNLAERSAATAAVSEKLRKAQEETGLEFLPPAPQYPDSASGAASTLFGATFAARAFDHQAHVLVGAAVVKLSKELESRRALASECQGQIDRAAEELALTVEAARAHKLRVSQSVAKEREELNDQGDSFYQGCGLGLGMGCLSLSGYILLTVATAFAGRGTGTGSPMAALFLTMFVVPIGVAALLQIVFGLKRAMVESELKARVARADEACELCVEKARQAHASLQPELRAALEEAAACAAKIEKVLEDLKPAA